MKPKVLIIDDENDILEAITLILKTQDLTVSTHTSAPPIEWIIKYQPKLILLDMLLIGKSGHEICKELKSHPQTKDIPIILLSANPIAKLKSLSKSCNADNYLPKPFELTELITIVKKYIPSF